MNLDQIECLAKQLMSEHNLTNWNFELDRSKRRLGCCKYTSRIISLSRFLSPLREEKHIKIQYYMK